MRSIKFFFLLLILLCRIPVSGQEKDSLKVGVEITIGDSFTGVAPQLGVFVRKNKNEFALRFKTSLTYFNSDENIPMGAGVSYRRITLEKKRFHSFIEAEYENLFFKHYSYLNMGEKLYQVHELYFGYGVGFRTKHFMIRNTISYGAYGEVLMEDDEDELFYHISPKIKVTLGYIF